MHREARYPSLSINAPPLGEAHVVNNKRAQRIFQAECLNAHWFLALAHALETIDNWRRYYNEDRPHKAFGNVTPAALIIDNGATSPLSAEGRNV
jgi:transposase InsO family protein